MAADVVVIGGTVGLGYALAEEYHLRGARVTISGREEARAREVAAELGDGVSGIGIELADPASIAGKLEPVGRMDRLALVAMQRDENSVREYDIERAMRLVTLKLVGYTEVVHQLAGASRPTRRSSSSAGSRRTGRTRLDHRHDRRTAPSGDARSGRWRSSSRRCA